ncbi:phage tail tape measure protein [uncultured Fusobacterium sp.]|uniref:phage tail tape measure protein n=1 Tax=uncultured Fusobacterium sp. TaxID=159267 RepID=UPI0025D2CA67|nr:phage tail tape measure protein [uncultured Fusobacterium sp.]
MALKKGMEFLVKLKAQVDKALPGELKKMTGELKSLESQMSKYKKNEKNFEIVKKSIGENIAKYRKLRAEMRTLEKAKAKEGKLSKNQERIYADLARRQEKLSKTIDKQRGSYTRYKLELERQKVPMENLRKEIEKTTKAYKKLEAQQKIATFGKDLKGKVSGLGNKTLAAGLALTKKAVVGTAIAGGTAAGFIGASSARTYVEFNGYMKKVQAISGATAEEFKLLEAEAMRLGATTKFTAGESAAAMEKMALAGFTTKEIISGMQGVMDLAAAAGEDVAMVSDIITDNLIAFNMTAKDTGRFAEVLAWGMSKTNVTVEMLGESFKYASGSAGTLGVSLEEMVGSLGLMGDQAVKSGMAGRGLNEVFSRLVSNKDNLKKIGINIANSKGEFVGLVEIVKQFEKHTKNMSDIDKVAFLKNVFGEQGERAFTKLLTAQKTINGITYSGAEAVAKTVEAATKDSVGMAEKMKNIMLEGASGAMVLLESAWDGVKIALGARIFSERSLKYIKTLTDSLSEFANVLNGVYNNTKYNLFWKNFFTTANSYLKKLYKALEPGIKAIQEMLPNKAELTSKFSFLGDLIINIVNIISWLILRIQDLKKIIDFFGADNIAVFIITFMGVMKIANIITKLVAAIKTLKAAGGIIASLKTLMLTFVGNPWILIIGAIIASIVLLIKNWDTVKKVVLNVWEAIKTGLISLWDNICNIFNTIKNYIVNIFTTMIDWIKSYIEGFFNIFGELLPFKALKAFWDTWDSGKSIMENLENSILAYIQIFSDFLPIKIVKQFFNIWSSEMGVVDKVKLSFTQTFDTIKNSINGVLGVIKKLGDKIKEIPVIKDILGTLNIGIEPNGSHRNGLSYVPFDGYIAELHKGERVLTADENEQYGTLFNKLSPIPVASTNTSNNNIVFSPNITISVNSTSSAEDLTRILEAKMKELQDEFIKKIREMERRSINERRTKF